MGAVIKPILRHWVILDLTVLRPWLTDFRIKHAEVIDNHDGTYGLAFELRNLEPEAFIATSETMQVALERGMESVEPLPSGAKRVLRPSPNLQDLVARSGGYDRITPEAWAKFQADTKKWMEDVRLGQAEVIPRAQTAEDDDAA